MVLAPKVSSLRKFLGFRQTRTESHTISKRDVIHYHNETGSKGNLLRSIRTLVCLCFQRVRPPTQKEAFILLSPFEFPTYLIIKTVQVGTDVFNARSKWVNMKECGDDPCGDKAPGVITLQHETP